MSFDSESVPWLAALSATRVAPVLCQPRSCKCEVEILFDSTLPHFPFFLCEVPQREVGSVTQDHRFIGIIFPMLPPAQKSSW